MKRLFKVLDGDEPCYGGSGKWHLPRDGEPGEWMPPVTGELIPCKNGYHLCRERDLIQWLGPELYEAEYRGEMIECDDKIVVRQARLLKRVDTWNERTARLFACDCAERVLLLLESKYPDDKCLRLAISTAIETARQFADGRATRERMKAAGKAAQAATWDATWAVYAVTQAVTQEVALVAARETAWIAALVAAREAAWKAVQATAQAAREIRDAASDAAQEIAWEAERQWQTTRLLEYLYPENRGDRR